MTTRFFNTPYLLYEGSIPAKFGLDVLVTNPICIGSIFSYKHHLAFPVFIYNCKYRYVHQNGAHT